MALIDKLITIADAIRGKTGSTQPLTLDGMAAAIAAMESGNNGAHVMSGTFIPASVTGSYTIELPAEATSFALVKHSPTLVAGQRNTGMSALFGDISKRVSCYSNNTGTSWGAVNLEATEISLSEKTAIWSAKGTYSYLVPEQYDWVAW